MEKDEHVQICKCSNCDVRGYKGRQHWKSMKGKPKGAKREMCGRYGA